LDEWSFFYNEIRQQQQFIKDVGLKNVLAFGGD